MFPVLTCKRFFLCLQKPKVTLYFKDGVRRIDFVLAYQDNCEGRSKEEELRDKYQRTLQECGLHLELEPKEVIVDS